MSARYSYAFDNAFNLAGRKRGGGGNLSVFAAVFRGPNSVAGQRVNI